MLTTKNECWLRCKGAAQMEEDVITQVLYVAVPESSVGGGV
jgi:hypothetical protein